MESDAIGKHLSVGKVCNPCGSRIPTMKYMYMHVGKECNPCDV